MSCRGRLRFLPEDIVNITRTYLGRLSDIPPQAMPGQANLAGLPATRILLGEYDDLRSSGELFVEQLRDLRVPVVSTIAAGMLHGHLNLTPSAAMPEIERSLDFLAEALMPAEALQESQRGQPVPPSAR